MALEDDEIIQWMKELDIPITRQNYIDLAWMEDPPKPWTVEAEQQLPKELQEWDFLNKEKEDDLQDMPEDEIPDTEPQQ